MKRIIAIISIVLASITLALPAQAVARSQSLNTCYTTNGSTSATIYWDTGSNGRSYINKVILRSYTHAQGHTLFLYADSGTRSFSRNSPGTSTFYPNPLPYEDSASVSVRIQQNVFNGVSGCNYTLPLR